MYPYLQPDELEESGHQELLRTDRWYKAFCDDLREKEIPLPDGETLVAVWKLYGPVIRLHLEREAWVKR
jgi:hypothetical protein